MRSRPEHIVEGLREAAEDEAEIVPGLPMTESITWQAADLIEWLIAALELIRDGGDAALVAADALDDKKWRDAGPIDPPTAPLDDESAEWVRLTTEQLLNRIRNP